jgi:putative SOS response-associated peptidase YedK
MCGRYASPNQAAIEHHYRLGRSGNHPHPAESSFAARYNVTPQQGNPRAYVPVIRHGVDGEPELATMQWWLLPHWSKEPRIAFSTFNARSDKVSSAASYRVPFRKRRCLIPALGWFEWQATPQGKVKWWLHRQDRGIVSFAGLWDRWHRGDEIIESCTIIVGAANAAMSRVHDRMPVIIDREDEAFWLDTKIEATQALEALLKPPPDGAITAHAVRSDKRPQDDDATLIDPVA